jgi:Ca2+-binding RTX toxin-like protein
MRGGTGDDVYFVGQLGDQIVEAAAEGVDQVNSWVGHTLAENVENLVLLGAGDMDGSGNASANVLRGNAGGNVLRGAEGADTLIGGLGRDFLNGGSGADTFVFQSANDSRPGASRDVVEAFRPGLDKIDLSGIDANGARAGDQAFKFVGSAPLSGTAGELRHHNGMIVGDVNGDGRADFEIGINGGVEGLTQADFLL